MSKTWSFTAEAPPSGIAGELDAPSNADLNGGEEPDAAVVKQMDAARKAAGELISAFGGRENYKVKAEGKSDCEPTDHYAPGSITVTVSGSD